MNFKETVKKKKILEPYQKVHITAVPTIRTNRKETNKALSNNLVDEIAKQRRIPILWREHATYHTPGASCPQEHDIKFLSSSKQVNVIP